MATFLKILAVWIGAFILFILLVPVFIDFVCPNARGVGSLGCIPEGMFWDLVFTVPIGIAGTIWVINRSIKE